MQTFSVIGVRYAGDPTPPTIASGESRLTLTTARGPSYVPTGVAYVDAELVSDVQVAGGRQTTYLSLPAEAKPLATDTRTVWALVFALQLLLIVGLGLARSLRTVGARRSWLVAVPVTALALILAADQLTLLLPNLI